MFTVKKGKCCLIKEEPLLMFICIWKKTVLNSSYKGWYLTHATKFMNGVTSLSNVIFFPFFFLSCMAFSPYADLQTCSYQGRTVRLHYSLLQLGVYAETEDEHFAVCLQQGKAISCVQYYLFNRIGIYRH